MSRSVLNQYCNFSFDVSSKRFFLSYISVFAFQVVRMIHDYDHGVLVILYTFLVFLRCQPRSQTLRRRCQSSLPFHLHTRITFVEIRTAGYSAKDCLHNSEVPLSLLFFLCIPFPIPDSSNFFEVLHSFNIIILASLARKACLSM